MTDHAGVWEDQDGILRGSTENSGRYAARRARHGYELQAPTSRDEQKSWAWAETAVDTDRPDLTGWERDTEVERYYRIHQAAHKNSTWAQRHSVAITSHAAGVMGAGFTVGILAAGAGADVGAGSVALAAAAAGAVYTGLASVARRALKPTGSEADQVAAEAIGRP
ncbi:hypothetical protein [Leifsonia sp. Leaf264]|uniref:hypothetical protein n=1 Tax=Leifsonia sp. Leaf264 TaxID=1736314 RepID=UPI0006FA01D8|nr:hypothetical protein [Leifsonia sp. Leaf264]KQO98918.1 hypothetical protein ASF30_12725 [Leifsonia sp. Leaf264]